MLTLLREVSLRLLVRTPFRTALLVLSIAFGVAVFVATEATSDSMLRSFKELAARVAGTADLTVQGNQAGVDGRWVADLVELPGVAHAAAALEINTQIVSDGSPLLVLGVDFLGDTHFLPFEPKEGQEDLVEDPLAFANDPHALLITRTLAEQRKLAVDDELSLLTADGAQPFTIKGVLDDSGPAASFGGQVVVMFLDAAQVAFSRGRQVDRIDVAIEPDADREAVRAAIEKRLAGKAEVLLPEQRGDQLRALVGPLQQGLRVSGYIALLVGMFIIYNAVGVSVSQRRRELGVLRALGVLRRGVVVHLCAEAALLSLPGSLFGLWLGDYLVRASHNQTLDALRHMYTLAPEVPEVSRVLASQAVLAGLAMSVTAAYLPARRGARMDPVDAMRMGGPAAAARIPAARLLFGGLVLMLVTRLLGAWLPFVRASGLTAIASMIGSAMCAPALVIGVRRALLRVTEALFGVVGRLGLDNVQRSLGRSSVNVLALWVSVAMSIAVGGWLGSFEHAVRNWFDRVSSSELTITAGSPLLDRRAVPLSDAVLDTVRGTPGVRRVQPLRKVEQGQALGGLALVATDLTLFLEEGARRGTGWDVIAGPDPIPLHALSEAPRVLLSNNAARRLGLGVGDTLTLDTMEGPQALEVYAVVVDFTSDRGSAFIDRERYVQLFHDPAVNGLNVYLESGAEPKTVAQAIRGRLSGGDYLYVTETTEVRKHVSALLAKSFSHVRMLELIVLFIALFGVVGTLLAAVLDRMREIGTLRAIGASQAQVAAALVLEASFLGLCAVLGGVASGAVQCVLLLEAVAAAPGGWTLSFVFPWEPTLRIALAVIGTAALSGLIPGRTAARVPIRDAIAYE